MNWGLGAAETEEKKRVVRCRKQSLRRCRRWWRCRQERFVCMAKTTTIRSGYAIIDGENWETFSTSWKHRLPIPPTAKHHHSHDKVPIRISIQLKIFLLRFAASLFVIFWTNFWAFGCSSDWWPPLNLRSSEGTMGKNKGAGCGRFWGIDFIQVQSKIYHHVHF